MEGIVKDNISEMVILGYDGKYPVIKGYCKASGIKEQMKKLKRLFSSGVV